MSHPPARRWLAAAAPALWTACLMAAFCLPWAIRSALWTDEIYSLLAASKTYPDLFGSFWAYVPFYYDHPPLYFALLRLMLLFGDSPLLLRLPSLLFIGGAIAVCLGGFRRSGGGSIPAMALAALLVLHPELRSQSFNIRMYPLVILIASLSLFLLERLISADSPGERRLPAAALALLLAALFYTSYFGLLFGAGMGLLSLAAMARPALFGASDRGFGFALLAACLAGLALFLPWTPPLLRMVREENAAEIIAWSATPPTRLDQALRALLELAGGRAGLLFLAVGWLALALRGEAGRRGRWFLFAAGLALLPFAALAISTPASRHFNSRYLVFSIPVLFMGAARGIAALCAPWPRRWSAPLAAALFLLPAPFFWMLGREGIFQPMPDWWAAARIIETNAAPGESILAGGTLSAEELDYHLKDPARFNILRGLMRMDDFYVACRDPRVAWYVNSAPVPDGYMRILRKYYPYRVEFPGNRFMMNELIRVYAKRPFKLPWGVDAPRFEPVPLDYEEAAKQKQSAEAPGR